MKKVSRRSLPAVVLSAGLVLTACGGAGGSAGAVDSVSIYSTQPENPLIPGDTNEIGGSKPIDLLWSGLYRYDPKSGKPIPEMAQSVTKKSPTVYDIKIKQGWKFHDGTTVKAKNFVDAWNYVAYQPNAMLDSNYFSPIKGYSEVAPAKGEPTAKTMSGLKLISDTEFQVTLEQPFSTFESTLGYFPFDPMPDSFFKAKDKKEWAKNPIGNGPMKFTAFSPDRYIRLARVDTYTGDAKVKFNNVEFRIYQTAEAGYADLQAGALDFSDTIPPNAVIGDKYKQDLQGRAAADDVMTVATLALPQYIPAYKDPNLRKALSLAIDREQIVKQIFGETRTVADGWVPTIVPGSQPGACGDLCKFNPELAKQYLAKSGFKGDIAISSNSDSGNKEWIDAACISITKSIGLKCNPNILSSFGQFSALTRAKKASGPFRQTWIADYPTVENFLTQNYSTAGTANRVEYSNPEFDKKLKEAGSAKSEEQGNKLYSDAEKMLAGDMPSIPLWFYKEPNGWSPKLSKGVLSLFNRPYVPGFEPATK